MATWIVILHTADKAEKIRAGARGEAGFIPDEFGVELRYHPSH